MRHFPRGDIIYPLLVVVALLIGLYRIGTGTPPMAPPTPSAADMETGDVIVRQDRRSAAADAESIDPKPEKKNVLLLFPYQADLPQTVLATRSIRDALQNAPDLSVELYIEYMDLNRWPGKAYRQRLASLYATQFRDAPIDLVFVTGEDALDFWLANRAEILPDTPVVFYDVETENLAGRQLPPDVFGIGSSLSYDAASEWILQTLPGIEEIVVVHGMGKADQAFAAPVDALKKGITQRVRVADWSGLAMTDIKKRAARLRGNTVIFYHLLFEDADGVKYRPIDALREIASVSAVPVVSSYDQFIGTGSIGGYMYSIEHYAGKAAQIGLRMLRKEPVQDSLLLTEKGCYFIFDHLALQRYGIPLSSLPPQSIVKNRQYGPWEMYRLQIIGIAGGFTALLLVAGILAVLNRKLKTARQELLRLNVELEDYARGLEVKVEQRTAHLREANRKLQQLSQLDGLTKIYNRRYFDRAFEQTWREYCRLSHPISVILADVDHFKEYNDCYGHQAGDECLRAIASTLGKQIKRSGDVLARYGGEEFVVVSAVDYQAAVQLAERLRAAVRVLAIEHRHSGTGVVSISLGVASAVPSQHKRMAALIEAADRALYQSKRRGRNMVSA